MAYVSVFKPLLRGFYCLFHKGADRHWANASRDGRVCGGEGGGIFKVNIAYVACVVACVDQHGARFYPFCFDEFRLAYARYDYVGAASEIEQYCFKNRIPQRLCNGIQAAVEELCFTILMRELPEPKIDVVAEYSEKHESAYITVRYPGDFRPGSSDDKIPLKVLDVFSSTQEYKYDEESGMSTIVIKILDR